MINKIYVPGRLAVKIDGTAYFKADDKEILNKYLLELMNGDPDVEVELSVVRINTKKSIPQLRYFYGVVLPVVKVALEELHGEPLTKEEVVLFLKEKYFYEEVIEGEEFIKVPMSFARATKQDVNTFLHNVIQFANEVLQAHIPEPN